MNRGCAKSGPGFIMARRKARRGTGLLGKLSRSEKKIQNWVRVLVSDFSNVRATVPKHVKLILILGKFIDHLPGG